MNADAYEGTLVAALERRARAHPERIAIVDGATKWTFDELSKRVDQVAVRLLAKGVEPSAHVGLHLRPSANMIASLLAILKVGAAYVPIDRNTPTERFRFIVEDAGVRFVITDDDGADVPEPLRLEDLIQTGSDNEKALPPAYPRIGEYADAYVIYTSGSTGKPKGVVCTHHNVRRLLASTESEFAFSERDCWTLFHSIAFDFSVWEVFGALLYGGTLLVVRPDVTRDTLCFARLLRDQRVTVLNQTPSAFYNLVTAANAHDIDCFSRLRYVILGGERVQCAKLARWFELKTGRLPKLINMYGITETTVHVTYRELAPEDVRAYPDSSPIGRPIKDLSVYLLDSNLKPVADGEVGEICVAGPGLAKGYLARPELTAQRFVSSQFQDGRSELRLYRSGDLGRRQFGELFYIGRLDRQVKIRGYRMELSEIEGAFLAENGVAASHVMSRDAGTPDARLVAHVIPDEKVWPGAYAEAVFLHRRPGSLLKLNNGMEMAYINRDETVSMYQKLFEDHLYETLGIDFVDGACVVDVGAHIGMFCLLAMTRCRNSQLTAVEPIPACVEALGLNLKRYGANASVHAIGLSDHTGADTLSNLIEREDLQRIDVLKIGVEKSEADVLNGIREEHWPLIRQIVVEVHDVNGRLKQIEDLLRAHGFSHTLSREALLQGTSRCSLYAWRGDRPGRPAASAESAPPLTSQRETLIQQLRASLVDRLPSYMIPGEIHLLSELPLTINGKVDERKLSELGPSRRGHAARDAVDFIEEQVKNIWLEVLKVEEVGFDFSLEDAGAHSLAAVMIAVRLFKAFGVEIPAKELRAGASIASIAMKLRERRG